MEAENASRRKKMSLSLYSSLLVVLFLSLVVAVAGGRKGYIEEREEWRRRVKDVREREEWRESKSQHPLCANISDAENLDHPAPSFVQTLQGSYTMLVEMTLRTKNVTFYVEEAREVAEVDGHKVNVGAVHITGNGTKLSYYYYPDDGGQMVEEMDGACRMLGTEIPQFNPWGWWDPDPEHGDFLYGTAAILRRAYFTNKRYLGEEANVISGVICECWQTCEGNNLIDVLYCFSEKGVWEMPWTDPLVEDGRLPVTMEVMFLDNSERVMYSVLLFVPFLIDPTMVQTPRGEDCEGAVNLVPDAPLPRAESHFTFHQEIVRNPLIEGNDLGHNTQDVSEVKLTYNHPMSLVRYDYTPRPDSHSPDHTGSRLRVIHDFNTGVQYVINENLGNCTRSRIPNNFFDDDIGGLFGSGGNMVSPDDLFHLDDTYALVGPRYSRLDPLSASSRTPIAILWSSTRSDIPDPDTDGLQNFPKAVLEYYFTKETQVSAEGPEEVDVPVRADVFVYNSSNPFQVVGLRTTNIYDFSVVRQYVKDEFYVGECVEGQSQDGLGDISYILIVFPADQKQEAAVRDSIDVFKEQLFSLILQFAQISPIRIAALDVTIDLLGPATTPAKSQYSRKDYGATNTVMATVTMLERPPYSLSYVEPMDDPNPLPGKNEDLIRGAGETELCAKFCSTYNKFPCKSFHLCGDQCYLSRVEGTDGEPQMVEGCHLYVLSVSNTSLPDPPTSQAYTLLFDAIHAQLLEIVLPYGENELVSLSASEAFHYYGYDPNKAVRGEFKLQASSTALTSPDITFFQMANLDDCLTRCINWKEFRCVTVSYRSEPGEGSSGRLGGDPGRRSSSREKDGVGRGEGGAGQCMLSSVHYDDLNSTDVVPDQIADVYSRLYVLEYDPVFGGVSLNTSGPVLSNVNSLDSCARYCTTQTSFTCQSFEWCPEDKLCHLHSEHFLDVVDGGDYQTGTSCIHFSSKMDLSFAQYPNQGWPDDKHTFVSKHSSASACAKLCIEETDEVCESFDFCTLCDEASVDVCGKEQLSFVNVCYLSTRHIGQPGMKLHTAQQCRHYSREQFGDMDYPSFVASRTTGKYTPADMAWLGVSMVVLGMLLTLGFLYLMVATAPDTPSVPPHLDSASDSAPKPLDQPMSYLELKTVMGESET